MVPFLMPSSTSASFSAVPGGRDGLVQRSHDNFVVRHALAPVLLELGAVDNALDGMDKVVRPVDAVPMMEASGAMVVMSLL